MHINWGFISGGRSRLSTQGGLSPGYAHQPGEGFISGEFQLGGFLRGWDNLQGELSSAFLNFIVSCVTSEIVLSDSIYMHTCQQLLSNILIILKDQTPTNARPQAVLNDVKCDMHYCCIVYLGRLIDSDDVDGDVFFS